MINSVCDLLENGKYFLCTGKDLKGKHFKPKPVRLLGIVQEFGHSELYVCNLTTRKKESVWVTNIFGINESGIGKTAQEAIDNYCKIQEADLERAYPSQEAIQQDLRKIDTAPNKFTYYNYRNVVERLA